MNLSVLTNVLEHRIAEQRGAGTANYTNTERNAVKREFSGVKKEFPCIEYGRTFPAKQNLGTYMRRYHKSDILVCPAPGCHKIYCQKRICRR